MLYPVGLLSLLLSILLSPATALTCSGGMRSAALTRRAALQMSDDPTANPFIQAINGLQEAIQTSPAAKFKCAEWHAALYSHC